MYRNKCNVVHTFHNPFHTDIVTGLVQLEFETDRCQYEGCQYENVKQPNCVEPVMLNIFSFLYQ